MSHRPDLLLACAERIAADLRGNILPFWLEHGLDWSRGVVRGELSNERVEDPRAARGALLTTRVLWTFAAAAHGDGSADYRAAADLAYGDLNRTFLDRVHGGYFWSVDASGAVEQARKQVYGQAFAIYALAEYHRLTGDPAPLVEAQAVFRRLEHHARDREHGGYFEAFARDWEPIADVRLSVVDQNDPKSQNTLLHVMEAYTNLLAVWPDADLRTALAALVEVMLRHVVDERTGHLGLFFGVDWTPRSDRISYGHDIEASWLLWRAVEVLDDPALAERVRPRVIQIAEVTLARGLDPEDGAVFNLGGPEGVSDPRKEWWPQAEGVVGFLNAAQLTGDERFVAAALRLWAFIETRLIDRVHGEWFRGVTREGAVIPSMAKLSFWKCPYHNGRAALEAVARLRALAARAEAKISPPI